MKEISLHILDIMQNSVAAGASLTELVINEDEKKDILFFSVKDNGRGMDEKLLASVTDPFTTGRTTRKVGLGIPLLKNAAEQTGGGIEIKSKPGCGTTVSATFVYSSIDRQPLGNMAETMHQLITSFENVDFVYTHTVGEKKFYLDTRELKKVLQGVSFKENAVSLWILEYLKEGETGVYD